MRVLSKGYDVAIMTISQAIDTLSDRNVVKVRAGVGCFVPGKKPHAAAGSTTVGIVLVGETDFGGWNLQLLDRLTASLKLWNAQLKYYFFNSAQDNWPELLEDIHRDNVKVLLRLPIPKMYDEDQVSANLSKIAIPIITIGKYDSAAVTHCVTYNLSKVTAYAVKQLVDRGHKNLALFYSGKNKLYMNRDISDGFRLGLQKCGINYEPQMEVTDYDSNGEVCMKQLSNNGYSPTGLIMTERFMSGVSKCIGRNKKLRDSTECIGIISNPEMSSSLWPNFAAYLLVPGEHLGYEAGKFAEKIANNPSGPPERYEVPFSILKVVDDQD